jgi:hypothetical protein
MPKISEKIVVTLPLDYYRELHFEAREKYLKPSTLAKIIIQQYVDQHRKEAKND